MRIVVTGCAGFIGSHLSERLVGLGFDVIGMDNFDPYYSRKIKQNNLKNILKSKRFRFHKADITIKKTIEFIFRKHKPSFVFHLAARPGVRPSIRFPKLYNRINIDGTLNLLRLSVKYGVKKFIFASSSSVYGEASRFPVDESHPTNPISPYGITKLTAEKYCEFFDRILGLKTISLRIFTAYGPRQRPDEAICKFSMLSSKGMPIHIYGDGRQRRDFTYIDDIVDGFVKAMESDAHGISLNLGRGETVELLYVVKLLKKYLGDFEIVYDERKPTDVRITHADISKAKRLLRWKPKVRIEEGIKKFAEWFEKNKDVYQ